MPSHFACGRIKPFGLLVLVLCLALSALDPAPLARLRLALFDAYQTIAPRQSTGIPVVVVDVDEKSLKMLGQWPWPRSMAARLIDKVSAARPLAVGVDIIMPEPDRNSLETLAAAADLPPQIHEALSRLPSNDHMLADALRGTKTVLGIAGIPADWPASPAGPLPPVMVRDEAAQAGLLDYPGLLRSLPVLDRAASGHGLLTVEKDADGVVRRIPLLARAGGSLVPGLAVDMLRLAMDAPAIEMVAEDGRLKMLRVGGMGLPVAIDGTSWVRFRQPDRSRYLSAADILAGRVPTDALTGRLVLVGVTGLGLVEQVVTPVAPAMAGVEVHAQVIETLLAGTAPIRPDWARPLEFSMLLVPGLAVLFVLARLPMRRQTVWAAAFLLALPAAGVSLFALGNLLIDIAAPGLGCAAIFVAMLCEELVAAQRQRRMLQGALHDHRLRMAHLAGELATERRAAAEQLQFIEMISHEYRTPLSVFRANLDVLEMRGGGGETAKPIARMRRAIQRLVEIIEVGLARARLDMEPQVSTGPVDLAACLDEAVRLARLAHPGREIQVLTTAENPVVQADAPLLKTAFLNLLDNALKYSPEDQPVELDMAVERQAGSCRTTITDYGMGIAEDELDKVFNKFYRAPKALAKPGTGMGLSITRRIVLLHQGRIDLTSGIGQGTRVTVRLPLCPK